MRLKSRLALVVVLFMAAFVACYSALLWTEVPERVDAETQGSLPWVLSLLPGGVDVRLPSDSARLVQLVALVKELEGIRHVRISLHAPDGQILASTPSRAEQVPDWFAPGLDEPRPASRKDVRDGDRLVAYFEVGPATSDELAELWEDFVRSIWVVGGLSMGAIALIVAFTFRTLQPLDRIRDALRALASGQQDVRLPPFPAPEVDEIAMSFNRMADAQVASNSERQSLLRKLVDSDEDTRRSVARDLHDELSPYLVAMQPLVRTLAMKCARQPELDDVAQTVATLVEHQSHILAKLRAILMGLHPPELETLGLRGAIERMVAMPLKNDRGQVLALEFLAGGDWSSFGPTLDVSIYRLIQECLTNARRHAHGAGISVQMDPRARLHGRAAIAIDVVNDCATGQAKAGVGGLGMLGMRDRCIALGGTFEAGATGDDQWRVHIRLPLDAADPIPPSR